MTQSSGLRDLDTVSKWLRIVGVAAVIGGIVRLLTMPKELAMTEPGWFESASAHNSAQFLGIALIMFGSFVALWGVMMSGRARRAALALQKQTTQAMSEGVAEGLGLDPKARLERLEALRRDGTLTDDEYRRKRAEIVDQL
ncbi:MAG TPA: hypothetical protein VIV40_26275 [Kofleriaceae bacterium]